MGTFRGVLLASGIALLSSAASAQNIPPPTQNVWVTGNPNSPIPTTPAATTPSTQSAATVTAGNTFQQALAANSSRTACLIQNTSSHTAYAYWLATGSASLTNSLQVPAGGAFTCADASGGVIKTAIQWTTGTTSDPFVVTENQ